MQELLRQIRLLDYGRTGNTLSDADIDEAQLELSECDLPQLPQETIDFLKVYNGFSAEGRTIFGIDSQKHFFYDIIGENLNAELENASDMLLLGESEVVWIAWVPSKNSYAIVDKESKMVLHKLDSFANAVRYILQIDD
ncbi:MAG: hypothetical protein MJ210_02840 [Alphaproteobacteria bacterium]|nr:hypothetical protein [Alphaproteobacteria bacterium]